MVGALTEKLNSQIVQSTQETTDVIVDKEQRHFYRMHLDAEVSVLLEQDGQFVTRGGRCRDLSAAGMALQLDESVEIGQEMEVKLSGGSVTPLNARVRVLRIEKAPLGGFIVGCEICSMQ